LVTHFELKIVLVNLKALSAKFNAMYKRYDYILCISSYRIRKF